MSEAIVAVEHVFKSVTDSTGTLDILQDIDFTLGATRDRRHRRRLGLGQEHAAVDHRRASTRPPAARCSSPATTCSPSTRTSAPRCARSKVGFVFQSFQLLGNLSALENVMLPLELADRKRCAQGRHRDARPRRPGRSGWATIRKVLSGGEQQRVALARAFVVQPALLLADEPTGSLDFATGEQVMQLMFDLNRELGTTLVLVTHDRGIAARCERRITIEAGRVVAGDENGV